MKNYIGFIRDHTGSMHRNATPAMNDYNMTISAVREASIANNQDTIITVLRCGVGSPAKNEFEVMNSNILAVKPITSYSTDGSSTPLWDSIGDMVESLQRVPDANEETVSFLVQVFTDGQDNSSKRHTGRSIGAIIRTLQDSDRWTFVFRVPQDGQSRRTLEQNGIHPGNILEWDTYNSNSLRQSTDVTKQAISNFYSARAQGVKSTSSFYTNLKDVKVEDVKANLVDISKEVSIWPVAQSENGMMIRPFIESRNGGSMQLGAGFYQLTKLERAVQDTKKICIRDKRTGSVYSGVAARQLLGLPAYGSVKLSPGDHGDFEIYIQSTSVNRKLVGGLMFFTGQMRN